MYTPRAKKNFKNLGF